MNDLTQIEDWLVNISKNNIVVQIRPILAQIRDLKGEIRERIAVLDMKTPHPTKTIKELKKLLGER